MLAEFKRILHWGPLTALFIIKCITLTTIYLTSMWLPAHDSFVGLLSQILFVILIGLTLYNFFCAACLGPGYVKLNWRPKGDEICSKLQFCVSCQGYKAPRAHHCRKCGRCVLKMDHHCPWINNCVGHANHANFTMFLASATIGSVHSLVLLAIGLYRGYHAMFYYETTGYVVYLTFTSFLFGIFSAGLAVGVIVAVGGLCVIQLKIILKNMTSVEDWIVTKAQSRERDDEFVYPYNLGWSQNFKQVFLRPLSDGLWWPVVKGCDQFTLTFEQLQQKEEKRDRTRQYKVSKKYSGSWFPLWSYGFWTCVRFPFSDESRIALRVGDVVNVTRWKRHWLYGQIVKSENASAQSREDDMKGWFPRQAVVMVIRCTPSVNKLNAHTTSQDASNNSTFPPPSSNINNCINNKKSQ